MDRPVDNRSARRNRWLGWGAALVAAGALVWIVRAAAAPGTQYVSRQELRLAQVVEQPFRESITIQGLVQPRQLVYLETVEGGRVEEIFVEAGSPVAAGDLILRLGNADLELETLRQEDQLQGALDRLRNTRLVVDQGRREAERQRLEIEHSLLLKEKAFDVQSQLYAEQLTPEVELVQAREEAAFWRRRLELFHAGEERDEQFRATQVRQAEEAVDRRRRSYETARRKLDRLSLAAPITGVLTSLEGEIGETKAAGDRLGQIDAGGFQVEGEVDQTYSARVAVGREGRLDSVSGPDGETPRVTVTQVYEEVVGGKFRVDLAFDGEPPAALKRGQRVTARLLLGDRGQAVLVPKGAFHQQTGGRSIFVVAADGASAERRSIRLGRQNAEHYEVLAGLEPGDRVVVSRYDGFGDNRRLVFRD